MRQRKAPTKNEMAQAAKKQSDDFGKRLEGVETAVRLSQMLLQQSANSLHALSGDIKELATRQRDIQYRMLAIQEFLNIDQDEINKISEQKQVADFTEASDKENKVKNLIKADVVDEDSFIVFTSSAEDPMKSILRSKVEVKNVSLPNFKEAIIGKKTGDTVDVDIQGVKHSISLLEILKLGEQKSDEQQEEK